MGFNSAFKGLKLYSYRTGLTGRCKGLNHSVHLEVALFVDFF